MKLYNLKKVVLIIMLSIMGGAQLQAMSLQKLLLIMFVCSPGTQTVAQQYIRTIKTTNGFRTFDNYVRFPDDSPFLMKYPSDMRNKSRFEKEVSASEKITSFPCDSMTIIGSKQ